VRYCSRNCQKKHWDEHKTLCTAIKNLYTSTKRGLEDSADENVFISHLTPSQRNTVAKLVGEKCHVRCELNGIETDVLWDTGAQVSIIPERVLRENFPNLLVKDIRELLATGADLKLEAANWTRIPYNGWVGINFRLLDDATSEISVPFLVTSEELSISNIGYNVIELFIKDNNPEQVLPAVTRSFVKTDANAPINFIRSDTSESLCAVRTSKKNVIIPKGESVSVSCRANTGPVQRDSPVLFEPNEEANWPSGLTIQETLTTIKMGKSSIIDIPVSNTT
jgi:hypothetical protein